MMDLGALALTIKTNALNAVNDLKSFNSEAKKTSDVINGTTSSTGKFDLSMKNVANTMSKVGKSMTMYITAPLVGLESAIIAIGSQFEATMDKVSAISGATGQELELLEEKARQMGATTQYSASQAGEALNYMAMAGWKTQEMLDGLDGVMYLAASSGESLAMTSDIVTDALTALKMEASESSHFADILATASANANTNVAMMGESFKYCAAIAGTLGYEAEDLAVALGIMANSGVKAETAGTSLRSLLTNLSAPTAQVAAAMEKYNISITDVEGNVLPLNELLLMLRDRFSGLGAEEQTALAKTLAMKTGMTGLLSIVNASQADFDQLTTAIANSEGAAQDMAETMNDNLKGQLLILKSNLQEAALELYDLQEGVLKELVEKLNETVIAFQGLDDETKQQIIAIAAVAAAIGPLLIVVSSLIKLVMSLYGALILLTSHPIALVITAVTAALAIMAVKWVENTLNVSKWNAEIVETIKLKNDLTDATDAEIKALEDERSILEEQVALYKNQSDQLEELKARQQELSDAMENGNYSVEEWDALSQECEEVTAQIADLESKMKDVKKALVDQFGSVEEAEKRLEAYGIRLENVSKATELVEKCTTSNSKALAQNALELQTASAQAVSLYEEYKRLSATEELRKENMNRLSQIQKELKDIMGESVRVYDEETHSWIVNEEELKNQIRTTDELAQSKMNMVNTFIEMGEEKTEALRKETEETLLLLQAQMDAYDASGVDYSDTERQKLQKKIQDTKDYITSLNQVLDKEADLTADLEELKEQQYEDAKSSYEEEKELGELGLREQIERLNSLKKEYGTTSERIIELNKMAQSDSLEAIELIIETEKLSINQQIQLYEQSRDAFCTTVADKRKYNQKINAAISEESQKLVKDLNRMNDEELDNAKEKLNDLYNAYKDSAYDVEDLQKNLQSIIEQQASNLVSNLDDLNDEELQNAKDKLEDILDEYKDSKYDITEIAKDLEDVKEEIYDREVEYVKSTVDEILNERKRLYQEEKDLATNARDQRLSELDAQLAEIEAQEKDKARQEKDQKYIDRINKAASEGDQEEYDQILAEYTSWLESIAVEDEKARIKAEKDAVKQNTEDLLKQLESEYNTDVENYNNYVTLEKEKAKLRKDSASSTDEELTKMAKESLNTQKEKVVEAVNSMSKTYYDELPVIQETFKGYGDALFIGITSRDEDIQNYLQGLFSGEIEQGVTLQEFNQGIMAKGEVAEEAASNAYKQPQQQVNMWSQGFSGLTNMLGQFINTASNKSDKIEVVVNVGSTEMARELYDPLQREKKRRGD